MVRESRLLAHDIDRVVLPSQILSRPVPGHFVDMEGPLEGNEWSLNPVLWLQGPAGLVKTGYREEVVKLMALLFEKDEMSLPLRVFDPLVQIVLTETWRTSTREDGDDDIFRSKDKSSEFSNF